MIKNLLQNVNVFYISNIYLRIWFYISKYYWYAVSIYKMAGWKKVLGLIPTCFHIASTVTPKLFIQKNKLLTTCLFYLSARNFIRNILISCHFYFLFADKNVSILFYLISLLLMWNTNKGCKEFIRHLLDAHIQAIKILLFWGLLPFVGFIIWVLVLHYHS